MTELSIDHIDILLTLWALQMWFLFLLYIVHW